MLRYSPILQETGDLGGAKTISFGGTNNQAEVKSAQLLETLRKGQSAARVAGNSNEWFRDSQRDQNGHGWDVASRVAA